MAAELYFKLSESMRFLQAQGESVEDIARITAQQGETTITIVRLLRDLSGLNLQQTMGAAL